MQAPLPLAVPAKAETRCDKLAVFLKQRPNVWIDARELLSVAGFAAWRTRLSELRKPPYNMQIDNRTRRVASYTESCYRYVPPAQAQESVA